MKVYPVGTVQLMRPRAELGRQSARQVGIADFSLSFCAQGFQRKRCQLFDWSMPGPGSFFAAVWALTSPWSRVRVQRDPFPSVPLVECHCHCEVSGPASSACPEVPSSSTGWANSVVGGLVAAGGAGFISGLFVAGGARSSAAGRCCLAGGAPRLTRDREVRRCSAATQWS